QHRPIRFAVAKSRPTACDPFEEARGGLVIHAGLDRTRRKYADIASTLTLDHAIALGEFRALQEALAQVLERPALPRVVAHDRLTLGLAPQDQAVGPDRGVFGRRHLVQWRRRPVHDCVGSVSAGAIKPRAGAGSSADRCG